MAQIDIFFDGSVFTVAGHGQPLFFRSTDELESYLCTLDMTKTRISEALSHAQDGKGTITIHSGGVAAA